MGRGCSYCTLWADGFNGLRHHFEDRAAFVVVSPDTPEQQKAAGADDVEEFIPDLDVPAGLVTPSSIRQHMMMVGTARTAVRSPQVHGRHIHISMGTTVRLNRCCCVL